MCTLWFVCLVVYYTECVLGIGVGVGFHDRLT